MTTIELQFFESAVRFFRSRFTKEENSKIDWEQRRFEAATQILAGMASNYHNIVPTSTRVQDAVKLADEFITILRTHSTQKITFTSVESECSTENQSVTKSISK